MEVDEEEDVKYPDLEYPTQLTDDLLESYPLFGMPEMSSVHLDSPIIGVLRDQNNAAIPKPEDLPKFASGTHVVMETQLVEKCKDLLREKYPERYGRRDEERVVCPPPPDTLLRNMSASWWSRPEKDPTQDNDKLFERLAFAVPLKQQVAGSSYAYTRTHQAVDTFGDAVQTLRTMNMERPIEQLTAYYRKDGGIQLDIGQNWRTSKSMLPPSTRDWSRDSSELRAKLSSAISLDLSTVPPRRIVTERSARTYEDALNIVKVSNADIPIENLHAYYRVDGRIQLEIYQDTSPNPDLQQFDLKNSHLFNEDGSPLRIDPSDNQVPIKHITSKFDDDTCPHPPTDVDSRVFTQFVPNPDVTHIIYSKGKVPAIKELVGIARTTGTPVPTFDEQVRPVTYTPLHILPKDIVFVQKSMAKPNHDKFEIAEDNVEVHTHLGTYTFNSKAKLPSQKLGAFKKSPGNDKSTGTLFGWGQAGDILSQEDFESRFYTMPGFASVGYGPSLKMHKQDEHKVRIKLDPTGVAMKQLMYKLSSTPSIVYEHLPVGDILFVVDDIPTLLIEYKTAKDFITSVIHGRFREQRSQMVELRKQQPHLALAFLFEGTFEPMNLGSNNTWHKRVNQQMLESIANALENIYSIYRLDSTDQIDSVRQINNWETIFREKGPNYFVHYEQDSIEEKIKDEQEQIMHDIKKEKLRKQQEKDRQRAEEWRRQQRELEIVREEKRRWVKWNDKLIVNAIPSDHCIVCRWTYPNTIYTECLHQCVCSDCVGFYQSSCPLCRGDPTNHVIRKEDVERLALERAEVARERRVEEERRSAELLQRIREEQRLEEQRLEEERLRMLAAIEHHNTIRDSGFAPTEKCSICLDSYPNVVYEVCQHQCVCADCNDQVKICPICRAPGTNEHIVVTKDEVDEREAERAEVYRRVLVKQLITKLQKEKECAICFSKKCSLTILQPCSHWALCIDCTHDLKACPLCREPIVEVLQVLPTDFDTEEE